MNAWVAPGLIPKDTDLDDVKDLICAKHNISKEQLVQVTRDRDIVNARKIFAYAAKKYIKDISFSKVGKYMGKDHSTMIYYINDINDMISIKDPYFTEKIREIEDILDQKRWVNKYYNNLLIN